MKNLFSIGLGIYLLLGQAAWAQKPMDVTVVVHGQTLPEEPPTRKVDGQVMVPLRPVFKALGASIRVENKAVIAQKGNRSVVLTPGKKLAKIDGKPVELEVPPALIEGSTYVPLRFVAEALGDTLTFDPKTKIITVGEGEDVVVIPAARVKEIRGKLKQLVVGNQGAILKVRNKAANKELYYRGLDDRDTAPYKAKDHDGILVAVELNSGLEQLTNDTMDAFHQLPRREAAAFLGFLLSIPDDSSHDLGDEVDERLEAFLVEVVKQDKAVAVRRQATLSMAVGDSVDNQVLETVLQRYETVDNLWETFPIQQYFEYHAEEIRTRPDFAQVRARVAAVNSLYTANILSYLDGKKK